MVTSKSTVLGIRLDHERRAWVESEAAGQGVTVRVLFERMIDRARAGETEPEATPGAGSTAGSVASMRPPNGIAGVNTTADQASSLRKEEPRSGQATSWPSQPSDLDRLVALPGEMIHAGVFVATTIVVTSGRCVRWSWHTCTAPVARCGRTSPGLHTYLP